MTTTDDQTYAVELAQAKALYPQLADWAAYIEYKLEPFQKLVRQFIMDRPYSGIFLGMGGGKAQPLSARVLTPEGFTTMGQIKIGDNVITPSGDTATVAGVFPQGVNPIRTLELADGRTVDADVNHLWTVHEILGRNHHGPAQTLSTAELEETLHRDNGDARWAIQTITPAKTTHGWHHHINPYYLGQMLGLGRMTPRSPAERTALSALGLNGVNATTVTVPQDVINAPRHIRSEVVRGIAKTSGAVGVLDIDVVTPSVSFATSLCELIYSLGGRARSTSPHDDQGKPKNHAYHVVHFRLPHSIGVHAQHNVDFHPNEHQHLMVPITAITDAGEAPTQCISVDHPDHEYVTDHYIRTHNTITTLSALSYIQPAGHILLVAPKAIATNTWIDEIQDWNIPIKASSLINTEPHKIDHGVYKSGKNKGKPKPDPKPRKLTPEERNRVWSNVHQQPPQMFFVNREMLDELITFYATEGGKYKTPNYTKWPFPTVILDESQSFKNPGTQLFKAMKRVRPHVSRLIELTGTPASRDISDIWAQIYLLDQGQALGTSMTEFRQRWFVPAVTKNDVVLRWNLINGEDSEKEIYAAISHLAMSTKNDSIVLPELSIVDHMITLDNQDIDDYKQFKKKSVMEFVASPSDEEITQFQQRQHDRAQERAAQQAATQHEPHAQIVTTSRTPTPSGLQPSIPGWTPPAHSTVSQQAPATAPVAGVGGAMVHPDTPVGGGLSIKDLSAQGQDKFAHLPAGDIEWEFEDISQTGLHKIVALNSAALRAKLLQFAAGALYVDLESGQPGYDTATAITTRPTLAIHDYKIAEVLKILRQQTTPTLIAYRFESDKQRLLHHLPRHGHTGVQAFDGSRQMMAQWNAGEIPVLLIHPASAGHGLNFQHGGHTMIWFSLPDSLEHYLQANARLHRIGQKNPVTIHRIIVNETWDARLPALLAGKKLNQQKLLDAVYHEVLF